MVRIGLVGCGGMGNVHYINYGHIENAKVVALCAPKEEAEKRGWDLPVYDTVEEMIDSEELDLVDVCTPTYTHHDIVLPALKKGKNVLCEKPLCLNYADAKELYDAAEENHVHLYVGQVLRFNVVYKPFRDVVKSGKYGKVLDVYMTRLSAEPMWSAGGWLLDKNKSGSIPYDLHIHDLDFLAYLFGTPIKSSYTMDQSLTDHAEHYRFIYEFEGGVHACAEAAWFHAQYPWRSEYRVTFEKAVLECAEGKVIAYPAEGEPEEFDIEEKVKIATGINTPPTGAFVEELSHYIQCVEEDRDSDIVTKEQILAVMKTLDGIER